MTENTLAMPIKAKPYKHQVDAFNYVCELFGLTTYEEASNGAALLMEMGCGKSLVGLAIAGILSRFCLIERVLIVCPLSVMGVWEEELAKFADFRYESSSISSESFNSTNSHSIAAKNCLKTFFYDI